MTRSADIVVIGAGMAGASIASELASHASVVLLEAEAQPGYHSTGRSAAFWAETYGGPLVQPLTTASGDFLASPPADFSDRPLLSRRGALHIADEAGAAALEALEREFATSGVRVEQAGRAKLVALIPALLEGWDQGLLEPGCADIDVAGLHAAYLASARRRGATLVTGAQVAKGERSGGAWRLESSAGDWTAGTVVNAAGAWADPVARCLGLEGVGIQPYRRTVAQVRVDGCVPDDMPLVIDAAGRFYFKPSGGGRLWLSPHDETECPASDCAAEEIDIALAIDRLEKIVDWLVERVERSWAGLRSFAPDRLPVFGFDPTAEDFFWYAGQGGFGIQTAPAAARLAAALLTRGEADPSVAHIDPKPYAAARFRS